MKRLLLALSFLACLASAAHAQLLTFDELSGDRDPLVGYQGLSWNNFYYLNGVKYGASGYQVGVVSPNNVAYNAYGEAASFSSQSVFELTSLVVTAAWNIDLNLHLVGSKGGTQVYASDFVLTTRHQTPLLLDWDGIDTVTFSTSGGTADPRLSGGGTHIAVDNILLNGSAPVPEPATYGLFGAVALVGITIWRRRRVSK